MNLVTNFKVSISSNDSGTVNVELFAEINYWNTILSYWLENCTSYGPRENADVPTDIVNGLSWPNRPLIGFYDENDMKAFPKEGKVLKPKELGSKRNNIPNHYILELSDEAVDEMTVECLSHLLQLPTTDCIVNIDTLTGQYMVQDVTLSLNDISHEKLCGILDILRKVCCDDEVSVSS